MTYALPLTRDGFNYSRHAIPIPIPTGLCTVQLRLERANNLTPLAALSLIRHIEVWIQSFEAPSERLAYPLTRAYLMELCKVKPSILRLQREGATTTVELDLWLSPLSCRASRSWVMEVAGRLDHTKLVRLEVIQLSLSWQQLSEGQRPDQRCYVLCEDTCHYGSVLNIKAYNGHRPQLLLLELFDPLGMRVAAQWEPCHMAFREFVRGQHDITATDVCGQGQGLGDSAWLSPDHTHPRAVLEDGAATAGFAAPSQLQLSANSTMELPFWAYFRAQSLYRIDPQQVGRAVPPPPPLPEVEESRTKCSCLII